MPPACAPLPGVGKQQCNEERLVPDLTEEDEQEP